MEKVRTGGPAFPCTLKNHSKDEEIDGFGDDNIIPPDHIAAYRGLSVRDYFAAKAMQTFLSADLALSIHATLRHKWVSEQAYKMADAMLAARGE